MIYYAFGNRKKNKIALTFDDGPNPPITNQVLNILQDFNVKGNFFLLGKYAKEQVATVKEILRRGHLIGVHGFVHQKGEDPKFEIGAKIIENIIGKQPLFYRPPYGDLNLCQGDYFKNNPLFKIVLFDLDPEDFKNTKKTIIKNILENVQNGSIIDLHDSSQHEEERIQRPLEMLKALPEIIKELKKRDFEISRLDEMDLIPLEFKN